jgi:DNA-binding transcriptional regulator LsrR (DeoR family)
MTNNAIIDTAVLDLIGRGKAILFIGAGFSLIPSDSRTRDRKGLKEALIDNYSVTLKGIPHNLNSMSMEDIVFYLRVQGINKREIAETLRGFIASSEELSKLKSFSLLRNLLTVKPNLFEAIITTNWDKGIEESLRNISEIKVIPLVKDEDCLEYNPLHLSVLKMHGDIEDAESIILSSQDFDVYEKEHPRIIERLRILFSTKYLILLGYAAKDENFRRIYRSIHYDVGKPGLPGGCIVAPTLGDREQLWTRDVNLRHYATTAQAFLSTVLSHVARVPLGISSPTVPQKRMDDIRFEIDQELSKLARQIKRRYNIREVWVARLRDAERPNREIGAVAAFYIETRCRSAKSLAMSTGETVDAVATSLDTSVFRNRLRILPTIVLLAGPRGFNDPSHVSQTLVSRFQQGRAEGVPLRLPDEEYLSLLFEKQTAKERNALAQAVRSIGKAQVAQAVESDVIVASVRPCDWFGGKEMPLIRTIPVQAVPGISIQKMNTLLKRAGVVAVHQMILLDQDGRDVVSMLIKEQVFETLNNLVCRPSLYQLKKAAKSTRKVITVASKAEKLSSIKAVLTAKVSNILILDEPLAISLLE